jgi:hypothetical protein
VSIVADFDWNRDAKWGAECDVLVDRMVARIAAARGEERSNLCHRAADLLWANLLSSEQIATLTASLYEHRDEYGLPAETGCYDSLVLLLPPPANSNELEMFRRKYLSAATADGKSWRNLRRTAFPIQDFRSNKQRNIEWTQDDLSVVLSLAAKWLESTKPQPPEEVGSASKQFWLNAVGAQDSPAARQAMMCDWLATLDNIVLLSGQASNEQLNQADALISRAQRDGWCVTQAVPSRALLGKVTVEESVEEIRRRMGDRNSLNVRQASDALVRWCELWRIRSIQIPQELLEYLGGVVATRRHEALPLLIAASGDVIERLDVSGRLRLFHLMEPGLEALLSETSYTGDQPEKLYTIGMKLRIRVACARLAKTASDVGMSNPILDQWITAIRSDMFADVRRYLAK